MFSATFVEGHGSLNFLEALIFGLKVTSVKIFLFFTHFIKCFCLNKYLVVGVLYNVIKDHEKIKRGVLMESG